MVAFVSLNQGTNTIRITFNPPWDRSAPGELYFWLASLIFLLPGATLIGAGLSGPVFRIQNAISRKLDSISRVQVDGLLVVLFLVVVTAAFLGNQLLLNGMPITDDEIAAHFGGQVLASGKTMATLPPMRFAFADLFLYQRAGAWTSVDFPGALAAWAFAELTSSDGAFFHSMVGLSALGLILAVMRRQGLSYGLLAGLILFLSPMGAALSTTTHTHVVSRGFLGIGLGLMLFVKNPSVSRSIAGGLCFGAAAATRPFENMMLLLPCALFLVWRSVRSPSLRKSLAGLMVGALPFLLLTLAYNRSVTGTWMLARLAPNEVVHPYASVFHPPLEISSFWPRFGQNVSYNALTLAVWFLGPLGVLLALLGANASPTHRALGLGILFDLALGLIHDDRGLHLVGPIHYSEVVLPMTILSMAGIPRLFSCLIKMEIPRALTGGCLAGYLLLGLPCFTAWHLAALSTTAKGTSWLVATAKNVDAKPAVVLVPQLSRVRSRVPALEETGSFVFSWPFPDPSLQDEVILINDSPKARLNVRTTFPNRAAFVFSTGPGVIGPIPLEKIDETKAASSQQWKN